jgi:prepilin-type N-terminal cleavage/methylation domain-containing protein
MRGIEAVKTASRGFTLVEMVIAMAIMLALTGALFHLTAPTRGTMQAVPEKGDMQQRLRVAVETLSGHLQMAGAGVHSPAAGGVLHRYLAPVMPYRVGVNESDAAQGIHYRSDAVTVLYVPSNSVQSRLGAAADGSATTLVVDQGTNCPPPTATQLCGFASGMRVALWDVSGRWDPLTITGVDPALSRLSIAGELAGPYPAGATIARLVMHTYYLEGEAAVPQLRRFDGGASDMPLLDHVVALRFDYFGEPRPPALLPDAVLGEGRGPWTTYGASPPPVGEAGPFGFADGENCLFSVDDEEHVPRLGLLGSVALVPLGDELLTDGPWCPSDSAPDRYDADLLRIRRVRMTLRVQVAASALRGRGLQFLRGGSSTSAERYVPDQEIRFDVVPVNMSVGR